MEVPDSNGFVNVTWPSKNVPHGGIFHTHVSEHSTEQQKFLKVLLEESKLDTKLRFESTSLRKKEKSGKTTREVASSMPVVHARPSTSRRRSLSAIRESGVLDVVSYHPLKKGEDREKLIERLANTMAFGDTMEQPPMPLAAGALNNHKKNIEKKLPTEKQKWNNLVTQIRERAEWLAEMEHLGEGAAHREIINEQIAERMRALDALGVDSLCSTARSTISGFSTNRSREKSAPGVASGRSNKSPGTITSEDKKRASRKPTGKVPVEECVAAYNKLTPLGYTPRRRQ